jgi:hypothetical protein
MLDILKSIFIGFLAISTILSFIQLSSKLNEKMHIVFSVIGVLITLGVCFLVGGVLR